MARYAFSYLSAENIGHELCVIYMESEPSEDMIDETEDGVLVGFTGNGYLSFWRRCREEIQRYRALCRALGIPVDKAHGTLADLYTGEERSM